MQQCSYFECDGDFSFLIKVVFPFFFKFRTNSESSDLVSKEANSVSPYSFFA
jgi:hypothetical protein